MKRPAGNRKSKAAKKEDVVLPVFKLPVTLLSGFLGAGKTTLLKHILESNQHQRRIAVIVNDMAALNIDASLIEKQGMVQTKAEMVAMQNGCICCTLRTDLIREIDRLQKMNNFDYLVIESTGIAEPMQVAESFCANPETALVSGGEQTQEKMLFDTARLDTCVTVVDAKEFPVFARSLETFRERFPTEVDSETHHHNESDKEGDKNIAQLLIEQVEFANVLVVNKVDLVSPTELQDLLAFLKTLNPHAKVIPTNYSRVDLNEILDTGLFSLEAASNAAGWLESLRNASQGNVNSEKDEYDVTSFIYKARKPFHPRHLHAFLNGIFAFNEHWEDSKNHHKSLFKSLMTQDEQRRIAMVSQFGTVLRSKGYCWIAGRDSAMTEWSQQGRLLSLSPLRGWYCDEKEDILSDEEKETLEKSSKAPFGDRRQEIVFIGIHLNQKAIVDALNGCLLTDNEMQVYDPQSVAQQYWDPLPAWAVAVEAEGAFSSILRVGQQRVFSVQDGYELELANISLNMCSLESENEEELTEMEISVSAVKVWLDSDSSKHPSMLLCTLRPQLVEQYPLSVILPPNDASYTLHVQVLHKKGVVSDNSMVEVHVIGIASEQEKSEDDKKHNEDDGDDSEDDEEEDDEMDEEDIQPKKKIKRSSKR